MKKIAINVRPSVLRPDHKVEKYINRVSSKVRGKEVAQYIGAKFNVKTREQDEVIVWIKPKFLTTVKDGDYVDVLDDLEIIPLLKQRPQVKVIAMTKLQYEHFKKKLSNAITLIPHHHLNFERDRRVRNKSSLFLRNKILVGGMIGSASPSQVALDLADKVRRGLAKVGIEFTTCFNPRTREEVIDYYKSIDFLVIFNPSSSDRSVLCDHPTKMINAASFGIPTLAQPRLGYGEFAGFYIPIETVDDIVREATKLKNPDYYNQWAGKLLPEAEKYHISNTSKLYLNL